MTRYNSYMSEIDPDFFRELCLKEGVIRSYKRQEYLLSDEVFPYIGMVESGVFKYCCTGTDGQPHTIGFAFEGEFVGDYPNCLYNKKPEVRIQALTSCKVVLCPVEKLEQYFCQNEANQKHARIVSEQLFSQIYTRYMDLFRLTPEERYRQLLQLYPEIIQKIPLKEIASYLHISPVHMSRIRKKLLYR